MPRAVAKAFLPLLLATLVTRLPAQVGAVAATNTLSILLPPSIASLWEDGLTEVRCAVGEEWVAFTDERIGNGLSVTTPRAAEIDSILLVGGRHCRWARRGAHGEFTWDHMGFSVAARLPAVLPGWQDVYRPLNCYFDMLGPADRQTAGFFASIYPLMTMKHSNDERFIIGVPGPGRWTVIVRGDGGAGEMLATCEAMTDVPAELPVAEVTPFHARVHFDVALLPGSAGFAGRVECLSRGGGLTRQDRVAAFDDATRRWLNLGLSALDMAGTLFIWRPGWEVQRVDGREVETADAIVERTVRPGRVLRVHVLDTSGEPVPLSTVKLKDEAGGEVPAAWSEAPTPEEARPFWWGKTNPQGVVHAHGWPAELIRAVVVSATGFAPTTAAVGDIRTAAPGSGSGASDGMDVLQVVLARRP